MSETQRVQDIYEKEAPHYDLTMGLFEKLLFRDARSWVCSKAQGETLELAVGTGLNLPHYPDGLQLTGIELSPAMLERARSRSEQLGRKADLRIGDATALDFPDGSFDTVVCTFSLCTIPDDAAAVAEVRRVLRPGGRFVLAEHVRSTRPGIRRGQSCSTRSLCASVPITWCASRFAILQAERFEIERLERYGLGIVERAVARAPGSVTPA